ncbi:MAG: flavin reductase [Bacteroidetes bacterium CG_4_10_14_3_um_filter_42_6]|nr:MAG: flavin reductase [Bacteroidetes bacterium CG_4_10_14_3_um_filter_42_6]
MIEIDPANLGNQQLSKILQNGVAPRPIALASTMDEFGNPNLSPFSFYNAFGINPTTLIFSPARRGRDNTTKHTLENLKARPEVVINAVTYNMVHQVSLSSTEYAKGVNEFEKSGLTPLQSKLVKPFRVKESPLQFECKVREIIETSGKAGSGNLVICEILFVHLDEKVLDDQGDIDVDKIDLVGRMGGDYYVRTSGNSKFVVPKPLITIGIGVDALPDHVRWSRILTGNDLGRLGNLEHLPSAQEIAFIREQPEFTLTNGDTEKRHQTARKLIEAGRVKHALALLLA